MRPFIVMSVVLRSYPLRIFNRLAAIWRYLDQMTSQACAKPRKYTVDHIWHADWSISATGRWVAKARRTDTGWQIHAIEPVGMLNQFRHALNTPAQTQSIWLGLDMPIGFARYWFDSAGVDSFANLLELLSTPDWQEFFDVCKTANQISIKRPFYPAASGAKGSVTRDHLVRGLGLSRFDQLYRYCERATTDRAAACPSFWTLGANQVGKAMLHGLKNLIIPGYQDGFNIWPFSGDLAACTAKPGVTVIETYPGEVYGWLGLTSLTKSKQESRKEAVASVHNIATDHGIEILPAVFDDIKDGFAPDQGKDDAFDALIGLMGLIMIAEGKRAENLPTAPAINTREGWIVGLDAAKMKNPAK